MYPVIKHIPYRICDHIQVQQIGHSAFYINFMQDSYFILPAKLHDWIIAEDKYELDQHLMSSIEKLIDLGYIEPDLSKIKVGHTSVYVSADKWPMNEVVGLYHLYIDDISMAEILQQRGFTNEYSRINLLLSSQVNEPLEISGSVILKSFKALTLVTGISCNSIRIENPNAPTDEEIGLLAEALSHYPVHIALHYSLSEHDASRFLDVAMQFKHRRLSISYDTCIMCIQNANNTTPFFALPGIQNTAARNVKISCGAGVNRFFIDRDGHIHSCSRIKSSIGNIYNDTSEQFLASLNIVQPKLQKRCQACSAKYFCAGGCKAEQDEQQYIFCNDIKKVIDNEFASPRLIVEEMRISYDFVPFDAELVKLHNDLSLYEYLCERNSLRVILLGYGLEEPLLWMSCGLFISNEDFSKTGRFSTLFSRPILDPRYIPIAGEMRLNLDWDIIDAHLAKRYPVLVGVDVYHMPYKHKTHYHSRHGAHSIILLEKTKNGYLVLDWCDPDYFFGEVSIDDLNTARTSENERDQFSVFTGYPISASYQLIHMDKLPVKMDLFQYAKSNLYQSMKSLLAPSGPLAFLDKASQTLPEWIITPGHIGYQNAIESFFFLDLELKLLVQYYKELSARDMYHKLQPVVLLEATIKIRKSAEVLKNRLILSYRRKRTVDADTWANLVKQLSTSMAEYCEKALKLLKTG